MQRRLLIEFDDVVYSMTATKFRELLTLIQHELTTPYPTTWWKAIGTYGEVAYPELGTRILAGETTEIDWSLSDEFCPTEELESLSKLEQEEAKMIDQGYDRQAGGR